MAYIYKITNDINNKIYIGKTEHDIFKRFQEHRNDSIKFPSRPLYRAINKYGIEHFHIELIEETSSPEEREIYWIEKYQSFKYGYNATKGGDGRHYLDYDIIFSTYEATENAAETARQLQISVDTVYTVVKQKRELKSTQEVNKITKGKTIKCFTNDNKFLQSFASLKDAARFIIVNKFSNSSNVKGIATHIRECANGERQTAYSFIWKW